MKTTDKLQQTTVLYSKLQQPISETVISKRATVLWFFMSSQPDKLQSKYTQDSIKRINTHFHISHPSISEVQRVLCMQHSFLNLVFLQWPTHDHSSVGKKGQLKDHFWSDLTPIKHWSYSFSVGIRDIFFKQSKFYVKLSEFIFYV